MRQETWYSPYERTLISTGRSGTAMSRPVSIEEKKIWLSRLFRLRDDLRSMQEIKFEKWLRATSTTASYSGAVVSGSGNPHKLDGYVTDAASERAIERKAKAAEAEIRRAIETIPVKSPEDQRRALMRYRYLQLMSWPEIAATMNYSKRQVHNLHVAALEDIRISRRQIESSQTAGSMPQ